MDRILIVHDDHLPSARGCAAVALRHVEMALEAHGRVERCDVAGAAGLRSLSRSFEKIRTPQTIVAFGCPAHIGLADFEKRSVFADALGPESTNADPERMVWSCVNTLRAVALGDAAWRSMQLLPIGTTCLHRMPPLGAVGTRRKENRLSVRIICHDRQTLQTEMVAGRLREAGFEVILTSDWVDDAAIHVHVGDDGDGDTLRLIDSLAGGRLVVHVPGSSTSSPRKDDFRIEHEQNGIVCRSVSAVPAACEDVCADPTFFDKLVVAGQNSVEPLSKGWGGVAQAILA